MRVAACLLLVVGMAVQLSCLVEVWVVYDNVVGSGLLSDCGSTAHFNSFLRVAR